MSVYHESIKIPLDQGWFESLSDVERDEIIKNADEKAQDPKVIGAIAAMLDMHQRTYGQSILSLVGDDNTPVYDGLRFSIDQGKYCLNLNLSGVPVNTLALSVNPASCELSKSVPRHVANVMLPSLVRDLFLDPTFFGKASEREPWLHTKIRRTGALDVDRYISTQDGQFPIHRISIQGGHSITPQEYQAVAEWAMLLTMADPGTEFVTGCGDGVMRAPFCGADQARRQLGIDSGAKNIGLTEIGILSKEAPNKRVDTLVTTSDIEARMEVFLRMTHEGIAFPGGVGTFEEIMTNLGVLMHPNNQGVDYPFYLLERRFDKNESYMDRAQQFLKTCFGDKIDHIYQVRSVDGHFEDVVKEMLESRVSRGYYSSPKPLWNADLYIPDEIGEPFHPTPERMSKLDLSSVSSEGDAFRLMVDLRKLFSSVVHWTVKDQVGFKGWNGDRPKLQGDAEILGGFHDLVAGFMRAGRMPLVNNPSDPSDPKNFPYEIPGA